MWERTKKQILQPDLLCVKTVFCIENAKFEKIKTWPWSKIIKDEGHVLGNANFSPRGQITDFFSKVENDHSFNQINGDNINQKS